MKLPYTAKQQVNNRTCWVFTSIVGLVVLLSFTAFAPTDFSLGIRPTRYAWLFATFLIISLLGVYFAWGSLPFCMLLGAYAGAAITTSGSNLMVAASFIGLAIGVLLDLVRRQ